jgi:N,N'-diacetyllegionaminate synthase
VSISQEIARPSSAPPPSRCFVIGEIAQTHDGSLGQAHAFIDALARAGADAIKFQTHIASAESTPAEPWRVKFSYEDATRYDYWKRMEFTAEQWAGLKAHAEERGIVFLSSAFSAEAVELLDRLEMAAWKIPSGEVSNTPLLARILEAKRPVLLSSGMSGMTELDRAVELVRARGVPLAVMQCTTAYPCPPERIGLNLLEEFRRRYSCAVGLSDHSGTIFPSLAAAALGAEVVEVHVAHTRDMFGPDVPSSVTVSELAELVRGVRFITEALAHPIDKDAAANELGEVRRLFSKSVVARQALPAGTLLTHDHLALKKPGTGIPAANLSLVVGRTLARALEADTLISESDLRPVDGR